MITNLVLRHNDLQDSAQRIKIAVNTVQLVMRTEAGTCVTGSGIRIEAFRDEKRIYRYLLLQSMVKESPIFNRT